MKFIIGIDEAGRGPLAGPVTVGAFGAEERMGKWILQNVFNNKLRDSKKLSHLQRVAINRQILKLRKEGKVFFVVTHVSNKLIDKLGISKAVSRGIAQCLNKLQHTKHTQRRASGIRLDGLLRAPIQYKDQKTIVLGDETDVFIACASISAKVSRDALMRRKALKYPEYGFEIHKGYGTSMHRKNIRRFGLSDLHRRSFCRNLKTPPSFQPPSP